MKLSTRFSLAIFSTCTLAFLSWTSAAEPQSVAMPTRGICAHRGASNTHPENTIPAFREAIRLGAQMIEFDVAISKDGQLVLMHDDTIDRTTNGTGPVGNSTLAQLKELDAGSWKGSPFKNTTIPTLDEA
ncbi:MAG: glycerophosphodiester phosphodiesterase family protein [Pirellulaceae bacterium]|nr:glycerophosphodiester phosphodiesterase family protein [Pirellulaceae bacterium]